MTLCPADRLAHSLVQRRRTCLTAPRQSAYQGVAILLKTLWGQQQGPKLNLWESLSDEDKRECLAALQTETDLIVC